MKNPANLRSGLRWLWILAIAFSISSCTQSVAEAPKKIYFIASGHEGAQIWHMNIDGADAGVVYEVESSRDRPANVVLPKEELMLLEDFLTTASPTLTSAQVYLTPEIAKMSLSPDGQRLAWIENDFGCYTPGAQAGCFGTERLNSLDLLANVKYTYWQSFAHQPEEPNLLVPGIESFAWSPDSRHIAFAQGTGRNVPCLPVLRVIDINTQNIRTIGAGGTLLTWSPDGNYLAAVDCRKQGIVFRIYNVESGKGREFPIESLDLVGHSISWSGQSNQVAFTATSNAYPRSKRASLYTLDAENGSVKKILEADNESYENPQWSPNKHLIAVDSRPEIGEFHNQLLVVDLESNAVIARLSEERIDQSWQWSEDGKSILVLLGNRTSPQSLGVFLVETNVLTHIPLPQVIQKSLPSNASTMPYSRSFVIPPKGNLIIRIDQPHW